MKDNRKTKRRRLFFDVEASPNIGIFWRAGFKQTIDPFGILKERTTICICYKWEDEREVYALTWDRKQDDKKMLAKFIEIASQATELIGHNGDKYDLKWLRTRCLFHRIDMFPKYQTLDTLKIARSKFMFNSNKLDYIARFLGFKGKIQTGHDLWKRVFIDNDQRALEEMVKYCKRDVVELEKIFKAMSPHVEPKVHYGVLFNGHRGDCPHCGSDELVRQCVRTTATGIKKIMYRCKTCFHYHTKTDK